MLLCCAVCMYVVLPVCELSLPKQLILFCAKIACRHVPFVILNNIYRHVLAIKISCSGLSILDFSVVFSS